MNNSRKRLIAKITQVDKTLKHYESRYIKHKKALESMTGDKQLILLATVFSFYMIAEMARGKLGQFIKPVAKFSLMKALNSIIKQI